MDHNHNNHQPANVKVADDEKPKTGDTDKDDSAPTDQAAFIDEEVDSNNNNNHRNNGILNNNNNSNNNINNNNNNDVDENDVEQRRCFGLIDVGTCRGALVVNCVLIATVLSYAFLGSLVFKVLEEEKQFEQHWQRRNDTRDCIVKAVNYSRLRAHWIYDIGDKVLVDCIDEVLLEAPDWTLTQGFIYSYASITTLGYGRLTVITRLGRIFYLIYGILGIPLAMICFANMGQFIREYVIALTAKLRKFQRNHERCRLLPKKNYTADSNGNVEMGLSHDQRHEPDHDDDNDDQDEMSGSLFLIMFMMYMSVGAMLLPIAKGQGDFIDGLYYQFMALTADFRDVIPKDYILLPLSILYITAGIAVSTIAIETGAVQLKRLHNVGRTLKNVGQVKIWFGGKRLAVNELVESVCVHCDVPPEKFRNMNLTELVVDSIAANEEKERSKTPRKRKASEDQRPLLNAMPSCDAIVDAVYPIPIRLLASSTSPVKKLHSQIAQMRPIKTDIIKISQLSTDKLYHLPSRSELLPLGRCAPMRAVAIPIQMIETCTPVVSPSCQISTTSTVNLITDSVGYLHELQLLNDTFANMNLPDVSISRSITVQLTIDSVELMDTQLRLQPPHVQLVASQPVSLLRICVEVKHSVVTAIKYKIHVSQSMVIELKTWIRCFHVCRSMSTMDMAHRDMPDLIQYQTDHFTYPVLQLTVTQIADVEHQKAPQALSVAVIPLPKLKIKGGGFKEKHNKLITRDPKDLHKLYEQEWSRLSRLSQPRNRGSDPAAKALQADPQFRKFSYQEGTWKRLLSRALTTPSLQVADPANHGMKPSTSMMTTAGEDSRRNSSQSSTHNNSRATTPTSTHRNPSTSHSPPTAKSRESSITKKPNSTKPMSAKRTSSQTKTTPKKSDHPETGAAGGNGRAASKVGRSRGGRS